jgi:hypothetical protein
MSMNNPKKQPADGRLIGKARKPRIRGELSLPRKTVLRGCSFFDTQLAATTASSGAMAPGKTDWSPLAGLSFVIWPDDDDPGERYADAGAGILTSLSPPATVRILDPVALGMATKQDAADFVQKGGVL